MRLHSSARTWCFRRLSDQKCWGGKTTTRLGQVMQSGCFSCGCGHAIIVKVKDKLKLDFMNVYRRIHLQIALIFFSFAYDSVNTLFLKHCFL